MPRYAALLRAINVGGHTVKMDELRKLFEAVPLRRVESVIASGNILFETTTADTAKLESRIEAKLEKALGYEVGTYVRTGPELAAVAALQPFELDANDKLQVIFVRDPLSAAARTRVIALGTSYDDFFVDGREIYWRTRGLSSASLVKPAVFARAVGQPGTARNVTTVRKLAEKLSAS
ncbi:MAG TPA: DUF1697 domain-containing protein [Gemmatimonadaceae bacterium]|nr:DUF1697 domain-containing protein [Gemmatimonadaceae bacterium]